MYDKCAGESRHGNITLDYCWEYYTSFDGKDVPRA